MDPAAAAMKPSLLCSFRTKTPLQGPRLLIPASSGESLHLCQEMLLDTPNTRFLWLLVPRGMGSAHLAVAGPLCPGTPAQVRAEQGGQPELTPPCPALGASCPFPRAQSRSQGHHSSAQGSAEGPQPGSCFPVSWIRSCPLLLALCTLPVPSQPLVPPLCPALAPLWVMYEPRRDPQPLSHPIPGLWCSSDLVFQCPSPARSLGDGGCSPGQQQWHCRVLPCSRQVLTAGTGG